MKRRIATSAAMMVLILALSAAAVALTSGRVAESLNVVTNARKTHSDKLLTNDEKAGSQLSVSAQADAQMPAEAALPEVQALAAVTTPFSDCSRPPSAARLAQSSFRNLSS